MAGMTGRAYTLVTVVFDKEYEFLVLQARSLRLFAPRDLFASVLVIDNSIGGTSEAVRRRLLAEYGDLASRVRFLNRVDFAIVTTGWGWVTQQILKLLAADAVATERYVVLDAKNHFVAPVGRGSFEAPDGRARMSMTAYRGHALEAHLDRVLAFVGLDPAAYVDRFPQTRTPFVFDTASVRDMVRTLPRRDGETFEAFFIRHDVTEFFLYSAWLLKTPGAFEALYSVEDFELPGVWPHYADAEGCRSTIASLDRAMAPVFGVHRDALTLLDRRARAVVAAFWAGRGLFRSREAAEAFILDHRARYPLPPVAVAKHRVRTAMLDARRAIGRALRRVGLR
jgi:hypothetical protein